MGCCELSAGDRAWEAWLAEANAAFARHPDCPAQWWGYGVSHGTFQLVVGDPIGLNLAVMLFWCRTLGGPTSWEQQQLHVTGSIASGRRRVVVEDARAGFRAEAASFHWAADVAVTDPNAWLLWRPPA